MKFSDKLTLSSTAVIAILFSTGATFAMVQNHDHLLQSYISRNMQTHDLESFSLESKLTQDATSNLTSFGSDEKAIRSRSMYYLQQVASHMNQPQTQYALLDTKHTVLYATGEKKLFEEHSLNDPQTYRIVSYNNSRIMLVSSQITVGKLTYLLESGYDIILLSGAKPAVSNLFSHTAVRPAVLLSAAEAAVRLSQQTDSEAA